MKTKKRCVWKNVRSNSIHWANNEKVHQCILPYALNLFGYCSALHFTWLVYFLAVVFFFFLVFWFANLIAHLFELFRMERLIIYEWSQAKQYPPPLHCLSSLPVIHSFLIWFMTYRPDEQSPSVVCGTSAKKRFLHDNTGCVQVLPHAASFGGSPRER